MAELISWVNGKLVPPDEARISVFDRSVRHGDAVYDVARSFGGKPFKLREHVDRLYRSLYFTRIDSGMTADEMEQASVDCFEANRELLDLYGDLTINQMVTRGEFDYPGRTHRGANVIIYCLPVKFTDYARFYVEGAHVVTPSIRRTPPECVPPKAKIGNKMNHFLAEFEAKQADPDAFPLMLDLNGNITESSGANFLFVSKGKIMVPNRRNVLAGVSMETVFELAEKLGIPVVEGDFTPFDVATAEEAFLASTSPCVLPVGKINGLKIGQGVPGPVTQRLLDAWSDLVGMDVVAQALDRLPEDVRADLVGRREEAPIPA